VTGTPKEVSLPRRLGRILLALLLAVVLLLGLLGWVGALTLTMVPGEEAVTPTHLFEDAPFGAPGPHAAGVRTVEIDAAEPTETTMWYPASTEGIRASSTTYAYVVDLLGPMALASFDGEALRDAPFDRSDQPYPLVVLSPGFAIGATSYAWLAEHLASYGFVVVAARHDEQLDPSGLWRATIERPQDVRTVVSWVGEQTGIGGELEGVVDPGASAVIGHSYGGYTALAAGGGRLDTSRLEPTCAAAAAADDPITFLCDALQPHLDDMARLAGLDSIPAGLWPDQSVAGVDAVVSMAGDALMFDRTGLTELDVPVMAIGGTGDSDSPYEWGTGLAYEHAAAPRKAAVGLLDAEHFIFTGPCEQVRLFLKVFGGGFCSDGGWDRGRAHVLIGQFVTAFLLAELQQDATAAAALAPERVDQSDLRYEAEGHAR
jgi:predicted dienelactone hydrolase